MEDGTIRSYTYSFEYLTTGNQMCDLPLTSKSETPAAIVAPHIITSAHLIGEQTRLRDTSDNIRFAHQTGLSLQVDAVVLTDTELIYHILSLHDPNMSCPFIIKQPCGSYVVDTKYYLSDGYIVEPIGPYVQPFLKSYEQVNTLNRFAGIMDEKSVIRGSLQGPIQKFLSAHIFKFKRYYGRTNLTFVSLTTLLNEDILAISCLYDLSLPVLNVETMCHESAGRFFEQFVAMTFYASCQPRVVGATLLPVQLSLLQSIGRYFDNLFSMDDIADIFKSEFIFYKENGSTVKVLSCQSTFWNERLVSKILIAASAYLLSLSSPRKFPILPKFSVTMYEHLSKCRNSHFITLDDMYSCLEMTCDKLLSHSSTIIFEALNRDEMLPKFLTEMQLIFCGVGVHDLLLTFDSKENLREQYLMYCAFKEMLISLGFSDDEQRRWSVSCDRNVLESLLIIPKLPWPYEYVVGDDLIRTINGCLNFLMKLKLTRHTLIKFRLQHFSANGQLRSSFQWCHLYALLEQPLTDICGIFSSQLTSLMEKKALLCLSSSSARDIRDHLNSLNHQLSLLNSRSGVCGFLIRGIIDKLRTLVLEITEQQNVNEVDPGSLIKSVIKERSLLVDLARSTEGTIFNSLYYALTW